jgi:cytochrome c553
MTKEDDYVKPSYCLSCAGKHSRDLEHHLEDLETGSKDNPEMREQARDLIDEARDIRRKVDEMRIEELAKKKLKQID